MATSVELYRALRGKLGENAAKMLAESIPRSEELATKTDIAELRADMRGWMLTFFVPLLIGVYGTLAAVIVSILAD